MKPLHHHLYFWVLIAIVAGFPVAAGLLRAGLVDELVGYTAGVLLGGDGRAAVGPLGLQHLSDAPRFRLAEARPLGGDLFNRWVRDA